MENDSTTNAYISGTLLSVSNQVEFLRREYLENHGIDPTIVIFEFYYEQLRLTEILGLKVIYTRKSTNSQNGITVY